MTDVPPPRTPPPPPPRVDGRPDPVPSRYSQASMWLVFLVLGAVILAAIAFSVDRSTSVVDPVATEPAIAPGETRDATEVVPADPAPATTGGDNETGSPGATGDTTGGTTGGTTEGTTGGTTGTGGTTTNP
jgi:hypothetical protein